MAKAIFFDAIHRWCVSKGRYFTGGPPGFSIEFISFFFLQNTIGRISPKSRVHRPNSMINACHHFFQGTTGIEKQNIPVLRHRAIDIREWRDDLSPVEKKKLIVESRQTGRPWYRIICIILSWSTI